MVGLAFEVNDVQKHQNNLKDQKSQETRLIEIPSFIEIFHYGYSYLGVLAGKILV